MKKVIITFVLSFVLLSTGCNENTITDPVSFEQANKTDFPDTYIRGTIDLNKMLTNPYPVINSYFGIFGKIDYELRTVYFDPIPPATQQALSVNFIIDADLKYFCTVCPPSITDELAGFCNEDSETMVPTGNSIISPVEKTFAIQGREDGMVLKATFSVSNDEVQINAMWLALPDPKMNATKNQY